MFAVSGILLLIFILLGYSLLLIEIGTGVVCFILGAFIYMGLSLLFNPRWNVFNHPFSPVVILKPVAFVGLFVNIAANVEFSKYLNESIVIVLLGGLFLVGTDMVGLLFKTPTVRTGGDTTISYSRKLAMILFTFVFFAGWLWRVYALTHGLLYGTHLGTRLEVTSYGNLLGALNFLSTIAFWGIFVYARRPRLVLSLAILEILWFVFSGSKASIVSVALSALLIQFYKGRFRISTRTVLAGLGIALIFVLSFSVIHLYRVEAQRLIISAGYGTFSPIAAAGNIQIENIEYLSQLRAVGERLNLAQRFSLIYEHINEGNCSLWYGKSFIGLLTWIIPRALWPDKPTLSLGHWFAEDFLGWDSDSRAEAGITIWGEGYLNFGIFGAVILPMLWVAFVQWVYIVALRWGKWGLIFFASAYSVVLNSLAANVASPFAAICQMALIVLLLNLAVRSLGKTAYTIRGKRIRDGNLDFHCA